MPGSINYLISPGKKMPPPVGSGICAYVRRDRQKNNFRSQDGAVQRSISILIRAGAFRRNFTCAK